MRDPIIGIDLGTSNTVSAFADPSGAVKVLADDAGYKIHPSVVSFHPNGGVVVGAAAKQRKVIDPQNTIYSAKRLIGRAYDSPEVQTAKTRVPYQIKPGVNRLPMIVTRAGEFAVPEISAIILDHARNVAQARIGHPVSRAVVTVPASFNDAQRSATATAGAIAGLTIVRVLNEPTAAALAYGHTRDLREIIAVYDFGGGTFDITLLKLQDQVYEVLGTAGDSFLGGDDLDERLVDRMVQKFLAENRIDLRTNEISMMRLRAVAEQTKIELSRRSRAVVRIDEIAYGPRGAPLNLQIEITRDEFVGGVSDIIDRTFPVCQEALALAGIGTGEIAEVILVGGTTKIPYVRDQVTRFFDRTPRADVNPEDAVAVGAALQATSLERILARPRTSSRVEAVRPPQNALAATEEATQTDAAIAGTAVEEPSGAVMAPAELTTAARPARRNTAGYPTNRLSTELPVTRPAAERIDTSYSVKRSGARDHFDERTRASTPDPLGDLTTTPAPSPAPDLPAQGAGGSSELAPTPVALGRLTRAITPVPGTAVVRRAAGDLAAGGSLMTQPIPLASVVPAAPSAAAPPARPPAPPAGLARPTGTAPFQKTAFGVPAAPTPGSPRLQSEPTTPMVPPPLPRRTERVGVQTGPVPKLERPTTNPATTQPGMGVESAAADTLTGFDMPEEKTRPRAPTQPPPHAKSWTDEARVPVAPPGARTLLAPPLDLGMLEHGTPDRGTPRGGGADGNRAASLEDDFTTESGVASAAATAKGFRPPQSHPVVDHRRPPTAPPPAYQPPIAPPRAAPTVLEVTPRSLGIATVAGYCEELIRRNSRVPAEMRKLFTTSRDAQDLVRIVVCQGESRRIDHNVVIGDLVLQGIPRRPRGETSIEVTFRLDASGILQVRARDAQTGTEQRATLDLVGNLPQGDVDAARDRMQQLRR